MAVSNGFNYGIDSNHLNPFWKDQSNSGGSAGVKSIRDFNTFEEVDGDVIMGVFTDYKTVNYDDLLINSEHVVNLNSLGRIVSGYPGMVLRIRVRDDESSQLYPNIGEDDRGDGEFPFAIVNSSGNTSFGNYAQARLSFAQGGDMTPTCASYPFEPACKTGTSENTKIKSGSGVDMYFLITRMNWKKPTLFSDVEVAALVPIRSFSDTYGVGSGYELFDYLTYGRNPIDSYNAMYKFGKFGTPVFLFSVDPMTNGQFLGVSISTYRLPEGFRIPSAGLDGSGSYTTNCFVDGNNMAGAVKDDIFVYIDEVTMGSSISGGYIDGIEHIELYRTDASLVLDEFTP